MIISRSLLAIGESWGCCSNSVQPSRQINLELNTSSYTGKLGPWSLATAKRLTALKGGSAVLLMMLLLIVVGCSSDQRATQTPIFPESSPSPSPSPSPVPITTAAPPTLPATSQPIPTPNSTNTLAAPLILDLLAPLDESGVEVGFVRVIGTTSGTSVTVNGLSAILSATGEFLLDITLRDGVNLIEVEASDDAGQTASQEIVVFFVAPTAGLPFTLLYPLDGLEVSKPVLTVVGATRPDAVVGVNEVPAEVEGSGIFTARVVLEEGANLLEVVAADFEGNVRFQTSVVFYLP